MLTASGKARVILVTTLTAGDRIDDEIRAACIESHRHGLRRVAKSDVGVVRSSNSIGKVLSSAGVHGADITSN